MAGKGSVILPNSFRLLSILHVPKLTCNLLFISKVIKDLNCVIKFFPNHYEFKEMETGKMIGRAGEHEGLYIFGNKALKRHTQNASRNVLSSFTNSNDHEIMIWHFRLGHPSFPYLKKLLPLLFRNKNLESFHCEFYQLSKHCRNSYVSQPYKKSQPFSLIHSDLWGPSNISNATGYKWFISYIDDCEKREKGESLIFVIEKLLTNTHWTWVYIYMLVGPTIQ